MPPDDIDKRTEAQREARWRAYLTDPDECDVPLGVRINQAGAAGYGIITIAGWLRCHPFTVIHEINLAIEGGWL